MQVSFNSVDIARKRESKWHEKGRGEDADEERKLDVDEAGHCVYADIYTCMYISKYMYTHIHI